MNENCNYQLDWIVLSLMEELAYLPKNENNQVLKLFGGEEQIIAFLMDAFKRLELINDKLLHTVRLLRFVNTLVVESQNNRVFVERLKKIKVMVMKSSLISLGKENHQILIKSL